MAVHCHVNNQRKWIIPQIYLQELTLDQLNRNIVDRYTQKMGQFESKSGSDKANLKTERNSEQNVSKAKNKKITTKDDDEYEDIQSDDFFSSQETWPSCDISFEVCESDGVLRNENEENIHLQIMPRFSFSNKRTRSDDCIIPQKEFPLKRLKKPKFSVKSKERQAFFNLLGKLVPTLKILWKTALLNFKININ